MKKVDWLIDGLIKRCACMRCCWSILMDGLLAIFGNTKAFCPRKGFRTVNYPALKGRAYGSKLHVDPAK